MSNRSATEGPRGLGRPKITQITRDPHLTLASVELASAQVLESVPVSLCSPSASGLSGGYSLLSCQLWGRERGQLMVSTAHRAQGWLEAQQLKPRHLSLQWMGTGYQSPFWDHLLYSRGSEEGHSFGIPLTSPGTAKRNTVRGHGMEAAQPFFLGTSVQNITEKASGFPLLGFPLPLLCSSHRGGLLEQRSCWLVLTAVSPPLGPRTRTPHTAGLRYGGHPRAPLDLRRRWHRALRPPRHAPMRKKGVQWCHQRVEDEEEGCPSEMPASSTSSESSLACGALDASPSLALRFVSYFRRPGRSNMLLFDAESCRHPRDSACA